MQEGPQKRRNLTLFATKCSTFSSGSTDIKSVIQGRLNEYCRAAVEQDYDALGKVFAEDVKVWIPGRPDVLVGRSGKGALCKKHFLTNYVYELQGPLRLGMSRMKEIILNFSDSQRVQDDSCEVHQKNS